VGDGVGKGAEWWEVRDGVSRECGIIERKLIRRKEDGLARRGFAIRQHQERGRI